MEPFSTKKGMERDGSFFTKNTKNGTIGKREQEQNGTEREWNN